LSLEPDRRSQQQGKGESDEDGRRVQESFSHRATLASGVAVREAPPPGVSYPVALGR
jgi:hypothetical protein